MDETELAQISWVKCSERSWRRKQINSLKDFTLFQKKMSNLTCLISCLLVFISQSHSLHVFERDGQRFLEDILRYYGQNNSISTEDLDHFLLLISARRSEEVTEENPLENQEVFYIYQHIFLMFIPINKHLKHQTPPNVLIYYSVWYTVHK